MISLPAETIVRFLSKKTRLPNGCWLWTGGRFGNGYGTFRDPITRSAKGAHHIAYLIAYGQYPRYVLHSCDNPLCVNPSHLKDSDHKENMADRSRKGRHRNQLKTHCPMGHQYAGPNLIKRDGGKRACATCIHHRNAERTVAANWWREENSKILAANGITKPSRIQKRLPREYMRLYRGRPK